MGRFITGCVMLAIVAASLTDAVLEAKRIEALRDANTVYVPYDSTVLVGGTVTK